MSISNVSQHNPMALVAIRNAAAAKLAAEQEASVIESASKGNSIDALKMHSNGMVATSTKAEHNNLQSRLLNPSQNVSEQAQKLDTQIHNLQPTSAKVQFEQILAQTQGLKNQTIQQNNGFNANSALLNTSANKTKEPNEKYGIDDLYFDFALRSYPRTQDVAEQISSSQNVNSLEHSAQIADIEKLQKQGKVDLDSLTLDFTALLPPGMRNFLTDLKCPENEVNKFVNIMAFGKEDGPHGQQASQYFASSNMEVTQLQDKLSDLVQSAKINTANLTGHDYELMLRTNGNALGQTLVAQGLQLSDRAIEQNLENTYKSDMALMQVLAKVNNQNASIF